jgi:hypothetical protein
LSLDNVKKSPQFEAIKTHWDTVTIGLEEVVTSDAASLNSLKKCDVKQLLAMASQMLVDKGVRLPKFGDVTVVALDSTPNTATLSYRDRKDIEPKQVEFVKVEGKWLPKNIANGWAEMIANSKSHLASLPGQVSAVKPVILQQLEGMNGMLDQIEQAKTSEQFNNAMMPVFLSIALGKGWIEQSLKDAETKPRKANAVHIFINRELNDREQTKLKDAVLSAVDDPNVEYEIIPNDGKTRLRFTPVSNIDVVLEVLQKEFEVAKVVSDSESRSIRVELK